MTIVHMVSQRAVLKRRASPREKKGKEADRSSCLLLTQVLWGDFLFSCRLFRFFPFKMPKRPCPFTESFSTQYKIHVGQKELNLHGVFGNKYRQEVYGEFVLKSVSHVVY